MTAPLSLRSRFAVRCLAALLAPALLVAAAAGLSAALDAPPAKAPDKPPRPPEEEDPDAKPVTHKVTSDEPDDAAKTTAAPRAVDLAQAARDAKYENLKKLFRALNPPHDALKYNEYHKGARNALVNIVPTPDYVGQNLDALGESFEVTPFPATSWTPGDPIKVVKREATSITPYEELALKAVDELLSAHYEQKPSDSKDYVPRFDQLVAAEQALTTVRLRLQSERQRGGRKGDAWAAVEDALNQRLLDVKLEKRNALAADGDWNGAFALTKQLAATYRTPKDRERIAGPLAEQVRTQAQSADEKQRAEGRRRLVQLAGLFPDNPAFQPALRDLRKQGEALLDAAEKELKEGRNPDGQLLTEIGEICQVLPELLPRMQTLTGLAKKEHPTLRVGVRELPGRARLWPTLAATDSDGRAVELLFESLMKLRPGGGRWEPALAEGLPDMAPPCGRQFRLPANARWSDGERINVQDVRHTVDLIKKGRVPDRPPVWGDLFDEVGGLNDQSQMRFTLTQGWLDPLALMNFKVMPSEADPATPKFVERPVGSGPFVYDENFRSDFDRDCVAFTANPFYGARPGKTGLPRIEKILFIAYKGDPADELAPKPGRLDLILDLTAKEAAALKPKAADLHFQLTGAASPNRRIWFLAVNHRKPVLAKAAFRLALACAIDRDKLLDDDFRASPDQNLHTALNGPYPVGSWAADPKWKQKRDGKTTLDPFDAVEAQRNKKDSGVQDATLSLKYPSGDPAVEKAMRDLAEQVKGTIGVTLTPEAVPADKLRHAVEDVYDYDLAYYHYDFPDDVFWLGPLLAPRGGPAGENYLGYPAPGEKDGLLTLMMDACRRRDFPQVQGYTHALHGRFLKEDMPFIPLWQLDPLAAVSTQVGLPSYDPPFDPVLVFTDVELWKIK
jgi:ABC-type transport system substrate-binding protein